MASLHSSITLQRQHYQHNHRHNIALLPCVSSTLVSGMCFSIMHMTLMPCSSSARVSRLCKCCGVSAFEHDVIGMLYLHHHSSVSSRCWHASSFTLHLMNASSFTLHHSICIITRVSDAIITRVSDAKCLTPSSLECLTSTPLDLYHHSSV